MIKPLTTTADLAAVCSRLAAHPYVAVDTEFMRETTFWPKLCLVQLAGPEEAVVVDAMAPDLDLAPFLALMRDERVVKVFHAARQDIEIVYHRGGFVPAPVFDTQIAAMVCGFGDSISYDQIVARTTGAHIDKSHRFSDWSRRPLSELQLAYAQADVTHLRDVYRHLTETLARTGRTEWVREEMAVLTSEDTYRVDPVTAWMRLKMRVRKPAELAVLQEVAAWREREAQERDVPRSRVLKDDALFEIAQRQPADIDAFSSLRAVPRGFERSRAGGEVIAAVRKALSREPTAMPTPEAPRPAAGGSGATVELLKVLLKMVCERHGVAAKVVATVEDLERIAGDDDAEVAALEGWRRDIFGGKALDLKHGHLALAVERGRVITVDRAGVELAAEAKPKRSRRRRGPKRSGDAGAATTADVEVETEADA
jgi:ribonuclease D